MNSTSLWFLVDRHPLFSPSLKATQKLQIVRDFGNLSHKDTDQPRTILSICTGALFLGASGLLGGSRATTHHLFLDDLGAICEKEGKTHVGQARYVDGVLRENGFRVITVGADFLLVWTQLAILFLDGKNTAIFTTRP